MEETLMQCEMKMEEAIEHLIHALAKIRTGRANPQMLDGVYVDYYGVATSITQIANVTVPEANQLLIKPYDRSLTKEFERAISEAHLNVNPQNEGDQIRIVIAALTEETRKALVKETKKVGEDAKVNIRNIRRDSNDLIKKAEKNHEISEDESESYQADVQKLTDQFVGKVDEKIAHKDKELMSV